MTSATVIVGVVLVPILTLGGIAGRIFSPLAWAYILAIAASLCVALTVTPALCAVLLPRIATSDARPSRFADALVDRYRSLLVRVAARPRAVMAATAVLASVPVLVLPLLGGRFLPEFHEGSLIAHVLALPGTSLAQTDTLARAVTTVALAEPAPAPSLFENPVAWLTSTPPTRPAHVTARVGRAELDEDAAPTNRIEMDFRLPDDFAGEWGLAVGDVAKDIGAVPGLSFAVEGFLGERIHEVLSGETAPVVVKVFGPDLDGVRRLTDQVVTIMDRVPGLAALLDLATARADLASARGARDGARARLVRLIGRTSDNDLDVADPPEVASVPEIDLDTLVDEHPRVRAALASVDAELAGLSAARRDWLRPSLVVDFDRTTQIFPGGVALTDREVGAGLSFALPVLDRGAEARAVGLAATWQAEARLEVVRADVRSELVQARVAWVAAVDGLAAHAETPEVLARDEALTADALATGEIDATERAVLIRRLIEAGRSYDGAVREVRVRAPRGSGHPVGGKVSRSCNRSWW